MFPSFLGYSLSMAKQLDEECLVCRNNLYRCNICGGGYCAPCGGANWHGWGICCDPSKENSWSGSVVLTAKVPAIPVAPATRVMGLVARMSRVTVSHRSLPRRNKLSR